MDIWFGMLKTIWPSCKYETACVKSRDIAVEIVNFSLMERIMFGDTGYVLSRVGLGLAALGRPGYINLGHAEDLNADYEPNNMMQRLHEMVTLAVEMGINYVDAAQSYGKSEDFLSAWLKANQPQEVLVGTKWGYTYTADWQVTAAKHEVKEHSLVVLNRQWHLSKRKLLPQLKLLQIHSATFESGVLENTKVLDRLAEIKDEGVLIGITLSGANQSEVFARAAKISVEGQKLFDSVQFTYNLLETSAAGAIRQAADLGLGVIIKEALANGLLTTRNQFPQYQKLMDLLLQLANERNVTPDAVAMAYVLQTTDAHVVLSGAATPDHLQSNIRSLEVELSQKEIQMLKAFQMNAKTYWQQRKTLNWN